jgi:hypothetical protein
MRNTVFKQALSTLPMGSRAQAEEEKPSTVITATSGDKQN